MISTIKNFIHEFQKDNVPLLAAAQAFYYLLSIVPLLILLLSILPYLNIDPEQALSFIKSMIPSETADVFKENIIKVVQDPKGGLLTVGILGTIWSASSGMNAFITATNLAFEVKEERSFIKVRLLSIALTFGMIFAIVIALILPVFGDVIIQYIQSFLNLPDQTVILFQILRWIISIVVMALVLMSLYHFAPNTKNPFKVALPGALIATLLWQVISLAFSFYISNFANYSATYGSLGGVIILMLWFFLTGLILMVGAEINYLYLQKGKNTK